MVMFGCGRSLVGIVKLSKDLVVLPLVASLCLMVSLTALYEILLSTGSLGTTCILLYKNICCDTLYKHASNEYPQYPQ